MPRVSIAANGTHQVPPGDNFQILRIEGVESVDVKIMKSGTMLDHNTAASPGYVWRPGVWLGSPHFDKVEIKAGSVACVVEYVTGQNGSKSEAHELSIYQARDIPFKNFHGIANVSAVAAQRAESGLRNPTGSGVNCYIFSVYLEAAAAGLVAGVVYQQTAATLGGGSGGILNRHLFGAASANTVIHSGNRAGGYLATYGASVVGLFGGGLDCMASPRKWDLSKSPMVLPPGYELIFEHNVDNVGFLLEVNFEERPI